MSEEDLESFKQKKRPALAGRSWGATGRRELTPTHGTPLSGTNPPD